MHMYIYIRIEKKKRREEDKAVEFDENIKT